MPTTRSAAQGKVHDVEDNTVSESEDGETDLEAQLLRALKTAKKQRQSHDALQREKEELAEELDKARQVEDIGKQSKRGKRGGPSVAQLQSEVKKLKAELQRLEKAREKDKKKIRALEKREAKADAADLLDEANLDVGDTPYQMRKLLRQMHDLVIERSLEENESCPICFDAMEINKCRSFPCDHVLCQSCLEAHAKGREMVDCPECRKESPLDEIQVIQYTATQQWDGLLKIAARWAKLDHRGEVDTSEEEAEEEFIDEGLTEDSSTVSANPITDPLASSPEPENAVVQNMVAHQEKPPPSSAWRRIESSPDTPEPVDALPQNGNVLPMAGPSTSRRSTTPATPEDNQDSNSYILSPVAEKRKRMEELAAKKRQKSM